VSPPVPVPLPVPPPLPPLPPLPPEPMTSSAFRVMVAISTESPGLRIPQSFLGLSHEWPHLEALADIPGYARAINLLRSWGSGPIVLRIGGGSTDMQQTVPGPEVWDSLSRMHKATWMRYIIGVNFYNQDVNLTRAQMEASLENLPKKSIMGFELGNEVRTWCNSFGCAVTSTLLSCANSCSRCL
jgi:hypothetical protein